jgi:hypothetical protein
VVWCQYCQSFYLLGNQLLLYSFSPCCQRKDDTVANVLRSVPLNVSFRHGLVNTNSMAWLDLVPKVVQVHLIDNKDAFRWNLTKKGLFTI